MEWITLQEMRGRVTAVEAAALVAGVIEESARRRARGEPAGLAADEHIGLDRAGRVRFTAPPAADAPADVTAFASLLRRLLNLDQGERATAVPGALMVMMARALREIDLPPPTLDAFRDALTRVAPDAAAVRARTALRFAVATEGPVLAGPRVSAEDGRGTVTPVEARTTRSRAPVAVAFALGCLATIAAMLVVDRLPQSAPAAARTGQTQRPAASAPAPSLPAVPATAPAARTTIPATAAAPRTTLPSRARSVVRLVLADVGGGEPFSPTFSADGRALYFHTGRSRGQLMRADLEDDGRVEHVARLRADEGSNFHAVPSPDGSTVAFDSDRDGVRGVYIADADGRNPRRVSGEGFASVPSWSPDGRQLAFVKADTNPRVWNVWIADVATGALRQVTRHRTGQAWGASWFPDGRRIAYSREDELVILDVRSGQRLLYHSPRPGQLVRTPAVSPDGDRIVFQVHGDGVWMLQISGHRMVRVLTDRSAEEFRWSPDGRRIAYHARTGRRWGVWTLGVSS